MFNLLMKLVIHGMYLRNGKDGVPLLFKVLVQRKWVTLMLDVRQIVQ